MSCSSLARISSIISLPPRIRSAIVSSLSIASCGIVVAVDAVRDLIGRFEKKKGLPRVLGTTDVRGSKSNLAC
jgi:hypothetical protein